MFRQGRPSSFVSHLFICIVLVSISEKFFLYFGIQIWVTQKDGIRHTMAVVHKHGYK